MSDRKGGETIIVGNFEVAMQLTQHRTMKISGYIYDGEANEAVNARLDAAQDAMDRQFVRADILNKEAQLAADTENLRVMAEQFRAVVEKKAAKDRGEPVRILTHDKQLIDKYDQDTKNINARIASLQAAIKAGRQRVNGALVS